MKFSLDSSVKFEAQDVDEALMKLALHFLAQMERRPPFAVGKNKPVDALGALLDVGPTLNDISTNGYIDIEFHGDYSAPEMLQ